MLSSKQRAFLRGQANTLDPVFPIGKDEIDENLLKAVDDCLNARELIKLRVLETSIYTAKEAAAIIGEAIGCDVVQVIGSKMVLYKQKPKDGKYADQLKEIARQAKKNKR